MVHSGKLMIAIIPQQTCNKTLRQLTQKADYVQNETVQQGKHFEEVKTMIGLTVPYYIQQDATIQENKHPVFKY